VSRSALTAFADLCGGRKGTTQPHFGRDIRRPGKSVRGCYCTTGASGQPVLTYLLLITTVARSFIAQSWPFFPVSSSGLCPYIFKQ